MISKSIKGNTTAEIQSALRQSVADGYKPTLAFVFITNIENAESVRVMFDKEGIAIFGASSSKKFTEQGVEEDDIVVLLLDINPDYFRIVLKDYNGTSVFESAQQVGRMGLETFTDPGFIISPADFRISGDNVIEGLMDAAGNGITIMGGIAGNPVDFSGIVFTNNASSTGGLLALIIDEDKIAINGVAVSGWKPVGTEKKITKSNGAWVYTIDNEPAMNLIQKYLGNDMLSFTTQKKGMANMLNMETAYPLQFKRASGNPMLKPVVLWNREDQSVMIGGPVKEGEHFRFSLPPDFDVIDTVVESTKEIKENNMPDADAMIVFSCVGRLGTLGPLLSVEIEGLAATWKKPMIGFFSLGEFGKLGAGPCELHGNTVSWVALKEK